MKLDYAYHYRKWNTDSPANQQIAERFYRRVVEGMLPQDKEANLLDVGCGRGALMLTLKQLGYRRVQGVECDPGQAEACRAKGLNVTLTEDTPQWLVSSREQYDAILAFDLLEHLPPAEQLDFASALGAALKPGGRLICTVPNANSTLAGRYRYIDLTHHCSFTEHSLDFLLYSAGFRHIEVRPVEYAARPRFWWLPLRRNYWYWFAFVLVRAWRRLEMMVELGPQQGRRVPLSLNILGLAFKP